jgi:hypothetical protein
MVAHLLPWSLWAWMMAESFSAMNGWCCTKGPSWLHHRRRHAFRNLANALRNSWRMRRSWNFEVLSDHEGP